MSQPFRLFRVVSQAIWGHRADVLNIPLFRLEAIELESDRGAGVAKESRDIEQKEQRPYLSVVARSFVGQLIKTFTDQGTYVFWGVTLRERRADDVLEHLLPNLRLELVLCAAVGKFPKILNSETFVDEEANDVVERTVFKPLIQRHVRILDYPPLGICGRIFARKPTIECVEDSILISLFCLGETVGPGD
jgi:hypothetical protein